MAIRKRTPRPYIDRGQPGTLRYQRGGVLLTVREPPPPELRILTLQALRRHNSLNPALQEAHRILLRWSENAGSGLPNPEADRRETHFDPLPPEVHERVNAIVEASPWALLTRKLYMTTKHMDELADELGIPRRTLYSDWNNLLWYFRGRFESERIHG